MMPDDREIDALLDSVAGGRRIDWEQLESGATSELERSRLRAVRDVDRLAEFHRSLQREGHPGGGRRDLERWGDLLLLERVGAGASGEVHRAWGPALQREGPPKPLRGRSNLGA